jgi:hypothetical protein
LYINELADPSCLTSPSLVSWAPTGHQPEHLLVPSRLTPRKAQCLSAAGAGPDRLARLCGCCLGRDLIGLTMGGERMAASGRGPSGSIRFTVWSAVLSILDTGQSTDELLLHSKKRRVRACSSSQRVGVGPRSHQRVRNKLQQASRTARLLATISASRSAEPG